MCRRTAVVGPDVTVWASRKPNLLEIQGVYVILMKMRLSPMLGNLNKREIIDLLERQFSGRLGCHLNGETYVVPVIYVYQNNAIYAHSGEGKKIEMLRANPEVCFQLDEIDNMFKWKSVILWGTFEELEDVERQQVMQGLILRIMPNTNDPGRNPSHAINPTLRDALIVYRINIKEATGRFESHSE